MAAPALRYVDQLNIALIALTCVAAHVFPYHLLVISYAVLGPAHYLTQISWLHDRQYFASSRVVLPILLLLTLFIVISPDVRLTAVLLSIAVGSALVFAVPPRIEWRMGALLGGILLTGLTIRFGPAALFIALLLPTVLHVFVFTACFMWVGAIKTGNASSWIALMTLLAGAATFLLPAGPAIRPDLAGLGFFQSVVLYMQSLLHMSHGADIKLFGFLSFAYTYHYLNWFSKAEVIRWHHIPRLRLMAIIILYAVALSVYAYDYQTGFMLLLFLSLLHVLLEFPLNLRSFATIAGSFKRRAAAA